MRKQISCIRCGIRLHPTDWVILKFNNQMPICDECDINYLNEDIKNVSTIIVNNSNKKQNP